MFRYTSQRQDLNIFKGLKVCCHQLCQFFLVISIQLVETVGDGRLESGKLIIVLRVQAFFLDELPQPFNQIEVG